MTDNQSVSDVDSDLDNDVSLEDIEVTEEELEQAENTDESDLFADDDDDSDDDEQETTEQTTDEDEETDEASEEEPELSEEDKQKAFRQEMYERRQAEKAARDATIQESQAQYLEEAQSAEDLALRQLQIDAYETKVERNTSKLTTQYERALKDFDVLRDPNPVVQRQLNKALDMFQAQHVLIDDYGNPADVKGDMYAFLQETAQDIQELTGIGAKKQVQSKGREKAKTLTAPNRSPKEAKVDPDLKAFWDAANS
jgi:hypothetical protein